MIPPLASQQHKVDKSQCYLRWLFDCLYEGAMEKVIFSEPIGAEKRGRGKLRFM